MRFRASIAHNNSSRNLRALLSVPSLSYGVPLSSYWSWTRGPGYEAGTNRAPIFHKVKTSDIVTCAPPKGPLDAVANATGFLFHSGYNRSIAFFRLAG